MDPEQPDPRPLCGNCHLRIEDLTNHVFAELGKCTVYRIDKATGIWKLTRTQHPPEP